MNQLTFALIKSKAIRRTLHPIVLARILENDFTIEYAQWIHYLPKPTIAEFYQEHAGRPYWENLERSISGHIIALVLSRHDAVTRWRELIGPSDPKKAPTGTLRALAVDELVMADNVVHGSDSPESAEREIRLILGNDLWEDLKRRSVGGT